MSDSGSDNNSHYGENGAIQLPPIIGRVMFHVI